MDPDSEVPDILLLYRPFHELNVVLDLLSVHLDGIDKSIRVSSSIGQPLFYIYILRIQPS